MFLVFINISTFRFNPSKKLLQLLVPIKFTSIHSLIFSPNLSLILHKSIYERISMLLDKEDKCHIYALIISLK